MPTVTSDQKLLGVLINRVSQLNAQNAALTAGIKEYEHFYEQWCASAKPDQLLQLGQQMIGYTPPIVSTSPSSSSRRRRTTSVSRQAEQAFTNVMGQTSTAPQQSRSNRSRSSSRKITDPVELQRRRETLAKARAVRAERRAAGVTS